jgi:hypothetical protein
LYKSVLCFEHIVKYSLVAYEVSKDYWQLVTVLCNEGDHWILCAGYDQTCNCWVCLGLAQTDSTFVWLPYMCWCGFPLLLEV